MCFSVGKKIFYKDFVKIVSVQMHDVKVVIILDALVEYDTMNLYRNGIVAGYAQSAASPVIPAVLL